MANTNAPFGFAYAGRLDGSPPNAGLMLRQIAYDNNTKIYFGDPVTSLTTGYIAQSSAGTTQIAGVFAGCRYISATTGQLINSMYWPGSGNASSGTAFAKVIVDPLATFLCQATSTAITLADIDANVQFTIGTGSTVTGLSAATVDTPATTNTLPFRVISLRQAPPGANGTDATTSYNQVFVTFNLQDFKSPLGIS